MRRRRLPAQPGRLADQALRHRLLEVFEAVLLQVAGQREGDVRRVALVRVDAQLEPVADAVADAADHLQVFLGVAAGLGLERA